MTTTLTFRTPKERNAAFNSLKKARRKWGRTITKATVRTDKTSPHAIVISHNKTK